MPINYNTVSTKGNLNYLYTTTDGGTVFSANLTASTAFDLFSDTAVANDAIYFRGNVPSMSDLYFDIGTAMAGTNIVLAWEYYSGAVADVMGRLFLPVPADWTSAKWRPIDNLQDDTVGFTVTGANTVKFPIQMFPVKSTINSISEVWIRCRIVSLTAITEGGANQTTRVQNNNGRIYIESYTEAVPCTFIEVYNYMLANYSYVTGLKAGLSFFDFKKTPLTINSPLITKCETIELGNWNTTGGNITSPSYLYYLRSGVKLGDNAGIDGSTFILYSQNNDTAVHFNTNTMCYGTRFVSRGGLSYPSGYPSPDGEFIDCSIEFNASPRGTLICRQSKWVNYGTYILSRFWTPANFTGNKMVLYNNNLGLLYQSGWDASTLTWSYRSTIAGQLFNKNQTSGIQTYNFYDCTPLPVLGATPANGSPTLIQQNGTTIREMDYGTGKVYFYDNSAQTFTDYTAAIKTGGAGNVPINGDVGDCLYILIASGNTFVQGYEYLLNVPAGQTSNDYVYAFEYYSGGAWRTFGNRLDTRVLNRTNNFTTNSSLFLLNCETNYPNVTINEINGQWLRIRIVTKGANSPVITTMRQYYGASWCNDWNFKEWYSAIFTVLDQSGVGISGATVIVKDKNGTTVLTKTTDANGVTTTGNILITHAYFDNEADLSVSPQYWGRGKQINYGPFEIYITKVGYETYYIKKNITAKINDTISLKTSVPIMLGTETGKTYIKLDTTNLTNRELIIDGE